MPRYARGKYYNETVNPFRDIFVEQNKIDNLFYLNNRKGLERNFGTVSGIGKTGADFSRVESIANGTLNPSRLDTYQNGP